MLSIEQCTWQPCDGKIYHCCSLNGSCSPLSVGVFTNPAVPILEEVLAAFVCGTSVSPQRRIDTTSEDTLMNNFSAAHLQRGSYASAAHMSRGSHVTGADPRTPAHGLPAQLTPRYHPERQRTACPPKLTPRYHLEHQCTACPLLLTAVFIVSQGLPAYCVLQYCIMSAAHMSLARIPERQRTACPHPRTPRYHSERQRTACPLARLLISHQ